MASFTSDTTNTLFHLAADLVTQSFRSIFLTGKAGTGKTTFLKYIRDNCPRQMAVVAPTGVAAINAGGVTIHSFFQLPLSPFIPGSKGFLKDENLVDRHGLIARMRVNSEKRKLLQQLELLIIDEVSMVRCDTMDAIDTVLRHFRRRPYERFGGVQVLLIGDMFQLPPVIKEAEWSMLSGYYESPYFFSSGVIKEDPPLYIELEKIYRQSDEEFINILNQVRNNNLDETGLRILESRYQPSVRRTPDDGFIVLTTHNEQARNTNTNALRSLDTKSFQYKARVEDEFPENAYPAEELLILKEGAQVMFIRNDTAERGKRYFNGKIGMVTRLDEDKVFVQCKDETQEIEVGREKWENIRYTLDKTSQTMKEEVLGSFTQFPLRLAWAITIHKSQGLTFEKAIIDAGEAFAPGQVYVALSRCTSLDGVILKSRLQPNRLLTDPRIVTFSQNSSSGTELRNQLKASRKQYGEKLLVSFFDFSLAAGNGNDLREYVLKNSTSFNGETIPWLERGLEKIAALQDTAFKFHSWLKDQFLIPGEAEENKSLQERVPRAAAHFIKETEAIISWLQESPAVTDSKLHAKEYNEGLKEIFTQLAATRHLLQGLDGNYDPSAWHQRKKSFVIPAFSVNAYAGASNKKTDSPHPALHQQLRKLRDSICSRKDLPIYLVAGSTTLDEMARYLPQSLTELRKISGFGDTKTEQYGQQFLDIILGYCREHNLHSLIHEKTPKRERAGTRSSSGKKADTYAETFRLYREGKTVAEIANQRKLATGTIEGHLAKFIASGDIKVSELVSREKILLIESALKDHTGDAITPVKQQLGEDISFGEIRLVMAGMAMGNQNK